MELMVVEDDLGIGRGLQVNLQIEGHKVTWVQSLQAAREVNASTKLDLIVLDLGLPDGSGLEFLNQLRAEGSRLPILILTAQTDEDSVVKGFEVGANDFVRKPFSNRELMARVRTLLKEPSRQDKQLRFGNLLVLIERREVFVGQTPIELNRREFDILLFLLDNAERVASREAMMQALDKEGEIYDRTLDSHISHLRGRLRKAPELDVKISSVYGVGYRLEKIETADNE